MAPVYSVFLAYTGEIPSIRRIVLDPASLTSAHLVQVLLREFHGLQPTGVTEYESREGDARLLIGNQAIHFRQQALPGTRFLDLGEEWKNKTGLPFVFALWLLRPDLAGADAVAQDFRALKNAGLPLIPQIVEGEREVPAELARRYLNEHIRFELGTREKEAIELFGRLLHRHAFVGETPSALRFV